MQDGCNFKQTPPSSQAGTSRSSNASSNRRSPPAHPPTPTPATSNLVESSRVSGNNNATTRSTPPLREDRSTESTSRFTQNLTRRSKKIEPGASAVASASQDSIHSPMPSRTADVGRNTPRDGHRERARQGNTATRQTRNAP